MFDNFVNEANNGETNGASTNRERGCHVLEDSDIGYDIPNALSIEGDRGKSVDGENVEDNAMNLESEDSIYGVDE